MSSSVKQEVDDINPTKADDSQQIAQTSKSEAQPESALETLQNTYSPSWFKYPKLKDLRKYLEYGWEDGFEHPKTDEEWERYQIDYFETDSEDEEWSEKYRPKDYIKRSYPSPDKEIFDKMAQDLSEAAGRLISTARQKHQQGPRYNSTLKS